MPDHRSGILARILQSDNATGIGIRLAIVFAIGFAASEMRHLWTAETDEVETDHTTSSATTSLWTCSMHPQIKLTKPGKCPICAMDLIPLTTDNSATGMRQLVISPQARALMNIQVTPVERRLAQAEIRMVGKVAYDETRLKHITAWVPGRLDRLFVDYTGVQVNKGDHMVNIYSEQLYSAQQELIEAAKAKQSQPDESPGFFQTGGIDLLESAREKLRLLGLTAEQIAEIEARDKPTDHTLIHAPMGGIVVEKLRQEGDRVNTGDRIYTVADLSQLWVLLDAYESDMMWLRYGQNVTFTTEAYPGEEFTGRVAFIDPVLDDQTRTAKVRVNIENSEGKLKPDMFIRGVVETRVAAGGRVIDANLEGKWISPMHPEIVKDEPGNCDICGMPLVRAESLGYVPDAAAGTERPLVIPVSAALVTGTRAIVYIEDPMAKSPTFEGREVVLGPRAGNFYLVRHGLKEGDLVVTNGSFRIDSALQIQARPSMMTPEGGGGGGHDHGGSKAPKKDEHAGHSPDTMAEGSGMADLPVSVRQKFVHLNETRQRIANAVQDEDLDTARSEFASIGPLVAGVDETLLQGHSQMLWKELRMLMFNDAVEGRALLNTDTAQRVLTSFTRNVQRLNEQFGVASADSVPMVLSAPMEFQEQLSIVWAAYLKIGDALSSDDFDTSKQATSELGSSLKKVDMKLLTDQAAHMTWMQELKNLNSVGSSLYQSKDIQVMRQHFESLSSVMQVLAMSFGFGEQRPVYLLHCPMAFNNRGASWLQKDDQTRNPYFGATMLKCADRKERIGAGTSPSAQTDSHTEHNH